MEAVPLSAPRHDVASHATRLPLSPHCNPFFILNDSLGDFHHSPSVSLASFADRVSKGDRRQMLWPEYDCCVDPLFTRPTQGRLRLHTALRPRRADAPRCRFISCFVRGPEYHTGSTSAHKNRSPRKQGRHHHAIGKRPESASAGKARLPPSTHPKLGVSSRHQRFHRCALQRIFSPSFGDG